MRKLRITSAVAMLVAAGCGTTTHYASHPVRHAPPQVAAQSGPATAVPQHVSNTGTVGQGDQSAPIQLVQAEAPAAPQLPAQPRRVDTGLPPEPSSEASPRELQPGAGEVFLPPPAIPPLPEGMEAWQAAEEQAQRQPPVTLAELEQLACASNPTLAQAKAQVEATFGMAIQAGLWPNPFLFYKQDQFGIKDTPGEWVGGTIRQEIVTADKRDLSRAEFLERTKAAEWQAMGQEYRVLNDVRMHYFRTLGRQELVKIQNELLKNTEDNLVTIREMYNHGQAIRADVHRANQQVQEARLNLLMAQNDLLNSWGMLTSLVGVEMPLRELEGPLEDGLEPIEWEDALARLLAESPEIQQAYANLRADTVQLKREKVEPIPNVFVELGAGNNFEANGVTTGFAQAFIEVPIFDWNQGTVRQAQADVVRQQSEIRRVELTLRQQLFAVYRDYMTALQHARNLQTVILPEARQAYEVLLDSYEDDRTTWIRVLDAERNYYLQRALYVQNLILWRESEVLIVGYLLHGGLTAPAAPVPPGHINAVPQPR